MRHGVGVLFELAGAIHCPDLRVVREWQKAKQLAWGDMLNEWHSLHGRRWPAWQCAGCEKLVGGLEPLNLPDGNRVHFEPIDCLISFGRIKLSR